MDDGLLKPGALLNNTYLIEERVGEGGTGEVYRAVNTASRRTVAVKILKAQFSRDPKFIGLMRRELLHTVSDDAVVRYYDLLRTSDEEGGLYFLVMDFIAGPSLADLMRSGPVRIDTLMAVAARVAQGLAACHAGQIFHRDISPDNIILRDGEAERATLIDFGIAKDVNPDAKTVVGGGFAGKYEYAAPEQLDGLADARSDIYSFGMTLLAAARGKAPQLGTSFLEIVKAKHAPVDTAGVSEPLRSFVDTMVRPDPAERPQTATELLRMLGKGSEAGQSNIVSLLETGDGGDARTVIHPMTRPPEPGGWGRKVQKAVAALVVLGVAGGAAYVALGPGKPMIEKMFSGIQLPEANPYRMTIALSDGAAGIEGNAPSEAVAKALASAFAERLPVAADDIQIELARGAPNDAWQETVAAMAAQLARLEEGRLAFTDTRVALEGIASSQGIRTDVSAEARQYAAEGEYDLALALSVRPQTLPADRVAQIVSDFADCGPLGAAPRDGTAFTPGEAITLTGAISATEPLNGLRYALVGPAAGRDIVTDSVLTLSPPVCRLRSLLPPPAQSALSLRLHSGDGAVANGPFDPEDFPVIELRLPRTLDGFLHAFAIDNEANALHLRPAPGRTEHKLSEIGRLEGSERVVPLTWPRDEASAGQPALGFTEPYGTSVVVALVTRERMFPEPRSDLEPTGAFVPDLAEAIAARRAAGDPIDQVQRLITVEAN